MHLKKSGWLKHWDFILADVLCLNLMLLAAYWIRLGFGNMYAVSDYRMIAIVATILHFCIAFFTNCYSGILKRGYFDELRIVTVCNIELFGLLLAYLFVMQMGDTYSRTVLMGFFFLNTIAEYLFHIIMKKIYELRGKDKTDNRKILILADEDGVEHAIEKIKSGPDKSFDIVGIALQENTTDKKQILGIPIVSRGTEVYEYVCRNVVDSVVLCLDTGRSEEIGRIANKFLSMGVIVHIMINNLGEGFPNVYFGHINGLDVMTTSTKVVTSYQLFLKRALDICAGIAGCLITGILYIFVAPAIKIADPKGPVFFGQERAGKNGRIFKIYKFRSMYSDAEERKKEYMADNKMDGLMFKLDKDPRIIGSGPDGSKKGLGHFLRSTSIDEFPNFWSILKGDMSLVGTRPPTMDEYEKYELHHKSRLAIKPGLTGIWQVSGRSDFTDFEEIVKLDNEYINNWSVRLDIKILLKTVLVVLKRDGSQ